MAPTTAPTVLTKMIYLDTRTRLRVGVMFMGQYDYHSQIYNHFNHERHLQNRQTYKQKRSAALIEWFQICAS
jgi:hypothetical protein